MFKIGEFSKLTQVSIRMLRYYDEMGLLKPERIDEATGYRFYSSEQIPVLNKIIFLRDIGFGVADIARTLTTWESASVEESLEAKRQEIEKAIEEQQVKLLRIEQARKNLETDQMSMDCNVIIRAIPGYQVLSLRRVVSDYYQEGLLWKEMSAFLDDRSMVAEENTFTIYHDLDYREENVDIEICLPVKHEGEDEGEFRFRTTEAVPLMACTMVYGTFENIAGAFRKFAAWLDEHNQYEMQGTSRQIVHRGPWNEEDPDQWVTEIQVPLKKRTT